MLGHITALTLADATTDSPTWLLVVLILTTILSAASTLGVGLILLRIRGTDARLARGEAEFKELHQKAAEIAVAHAIHEGKLREEMVKTFHTRREWQDFISKAVAEERANIRRMTRMETILEQVARQLNIDLAASVPGAGGGGS